MRIKKKERERKKKKEQTQNQAPPLSAHAFKRSKQMSISNGERRQL